MTLTVEDGTGLENADSYLSVADADAYHTKYGNTTWTGLESDKEIALRRATQYLDRRFDGRWLGTRVRERQALAFPRYGIEDADGFLLRNDELPKKLEEACAELALRALVGTDLMPDITEPGTIKSEAVRVAEIEERIEYMGGKGQIPIFREVDALLRGLITSGAQIYRG